MMKLKQMSRAAIAVLLASALVFIMSIGTLANGVISNSYADNVSTVTLSDAGGTATFTMNPTDTDLFTNFKDVMPGDVLGQTVRVATPTQPRNSSDYNIYLYARVHQEPPEETPEPVLFALDGEPNAHQDLSKHDQAFLDQLTIAVTIDGTERDLMAAGPLTEGVHLGRFARAGDTKDVLVTLTVPIEMGNDFAEKSAYIDWFFYAQGIDRPGPGPGPGPTPTPTPTPTPPPEVEVPEEEVPLGDLEPEPEVDIPDEKVPLDALTPVGDIPQTGDESAMGLWAALAVVSGGTLVFLLTGLRKKD